MLPFDYKCALYRRNNFGQPCVWHIKELKHDCIEIFHGIVNKTITREVMLISRDSTSEIKSRINAKRKSGYKFISEIKDNVDLPVEEKHLFDYLNSYLPEYRTTEDGSMLPMLAKTYDNSNNKLFKKCSEYIGQWKINGLRCFISAYVNNTNIFYPIRLSFQSREGTYWDSLTNLEDYLLSVINPKLLDKMVDEHYILDGELYLPGYSVNEINHFVKDPTCKENKMLQFWCYDIAIEELGQQNRLDILSGYNIHNISIICSKEDHLNNKNRLIVLPNYEIYNDEEATMFRDKFINMGFEGIILRNPNSEYQYGKRNLAMIKYKRSTDGKFTIVDIYPEGIKRSNIPLFLLKNDINNNTFEVHLSGSQSYQSNVLKNKDKYIGKQMYVEYGERSGVNQVPFHIKETRIL